jgi:hypothetical protein
MKEICICKISVNISVFPAFKRHTYFEEKKNFIKNEMK